MTGTATDSQNRQRRKACGRVKYCRSMRLASFLVVRDRRSIALSQNFRAITAWTAPSSSSA